MAICWHEEPRIDDIRTEKARNVEMFCVTFINYNYILVAAWWTNIFNMQIQYGIAEFKFLTVWSAYLIFTFILELCFRKC